MDNENLDNPTIYGLESHPIVHFQFCEFIIMVYNLVVAVHDNAVVRNTVKDYVTIRCGSKCYESLTKISVLSELTVEITLNSNHCFF